MKKNGFIFAETIIVITILCFGLITIYNTFSLIVSNQKEQLNYNLSTDIHNLYLIRDYILDTYGTVESIDHNVAFFECDTNRTLLSDKSYYPYEDAVRTYKDSSSNDNAFNMCAGIFNNTSLWNVYFVKNDAGRKIIQSLTNEESDVLNATALSYFRTLSEIEDTDSEVIIVGEFKRNNVFHYASLIMPKVTNDDSSLLGDIIKKMENSGQPNFSTPASGDSQVYKINERYYNNYSYYFRGTTVDNYLFFAGHMWRIVRINGDGSIRLILNSYARKVDNNYYNVPYNSNSNCISPASLEIANKCARYYEKGSTGDNSYAITSVARYVEEWFNNNITGSNLNYIVRTYFCNDASDGTDEINTNSNLYYYRPYNRLAINPNEPSLSCFNSILDKNPPNLIAAEVGLLSADEMVLAGAKEKSPNINYYLFNQQNINSWYTMSARYYSNKSLYMYSGPNNISSSLDFKTVNLSSYIRPVININAKVLVSGRGTASDPYLVKGIGE